MGFGGGEWEAWMGLMSMPCTNGGISQAMEGGGDKGGSNHAGSGGGMWRVQWGGCWCDCSTRVGSARWWWVHLTK